jgi:hypothetical protein
MLQDIGKPEGQKPNSRIPQTTVSLIHLNSPLELIVDMNLDKLHQEAMRFADIADSLSRKGVNEELKNELFLNAAILEKRTATLCPDDLQPSKAILTQSAAHLFNSGGLLNSPKPSLGTHCE